MCGLGRDLPVAERLAGHDIILVGLVRDEILVVDVAIFLEGASFGIYSAVVTNLK